MRFNIASFHPPALYHLRRDFALAMQYGLRSLGHEVSHSHGRLHTHCINLVTGAYFLNRPQVEQIAASGISYININTEVITNSTLNFDPAKTNLTSTYIPFILGGQAAWDVIIDNMPQYERRGIENAHFLRWGFAPELEDIHHSQEKEIDFYFFGTLSRRRSEILSRLTQVGFSGHADESCPYFVRNDHIARAKVQLNIIQENRYNHVNSFRICYLANNHCCILSEKENDPAGYLDGVEISSTEEMVDNLRSLVAGRYRQSAEHLYEKFRQMPMRTCMESLLDETYGRRMN